MLCVAQILASACPSALYSIFCRRRRKQPSSSPTATAGTATAAFTAGTATDRPPRRRLRKRKLVDISVGSPLLSTPAAPLSNHGAQHGRSSPVRSTSKRVGAFGPATSTSAARRLSPPKAKRRLENRWHDEAAGCADPQLEASIALARQLQEEDDRAAAMMAAAGRADAGPSSGSHRIRGVKCGNGQLSATNISRASSGGAGLAQERSVHGSNDACCSSDPPPGEVKKDGFSSEYIAELVGLLIEETVTGDELLSNGVSQAAVNAALQAYHHSCEFS